MTDENFADRRNDISRFVAVAANGEIRFRLNRRGGDSSLGGGASARECARRERRACRTSSCSRPTRRRVTSFCAPFQFAVRERLARTRV